MDSLDAETEVQKTDAEIRLELRRLRAREIAAQKRVSRVVKIHHTMKASLALRPDARDALRRVVYFWVRQTVVGKQEAI